MPIDHLTGHSELFFRTYLHTVFPLHAALVEAMCKARHVPQELATVLEDIGQGYCRLADEINNELVRRGELIVEPDAEESNEERIEAFIATVVGNLGPVAFHDGQVVDARRAVEAHPVATDALRAALLLARGSRRASQAASGGRP